MKKEGAGGLLACGVVVLIILGWIRSSAMEQAAATGVTGHYQFSEIGQIGLALSFILIVVGLVKSAFGT